MAALQNSYGYSFPVDWPLTTTIPPSESDEEGLQEKEKSKKGKGKEVVLTSKDMKDNYNPNWIPGESFRLMDLPAELRVFVYQFLLPHNMGITFVRSYYYNTLSKQPTWRVLGGPKGGGSSTCIIAVSPLIGPQRGRDSRIPQYEFPGHPGLEPQLFLVNKAVSNEARAVLYGSNTFRFVIDGLSHEPSSLRSPQIFGPFGYNHMLPILRNLRSIHLEVLNDNHDHWTVIRQRARLEYFIEVLKEHADDENRKSLLEELKVEVRQGPVPRRKLTRYYGIGIPPPPQPNGLVSEKFMFGLESLATLQGIKKVNIQGVPEWYAKCLQVCIQGKGGDVETVDWPLVQVKRRKGAFKTTIKKSMVTKRKWYQPMLNWKEYGERNQIALPPDIDKFWKDRC